MENLKLVVSSTISVGGLSTLTLDNDNDRYHAHFFLTLIHDGDTEVKTIQPVSIRLSGGQPMHGVVKTMEILLFNYLRWQANRLELMKLLLILQVLFILSSTMKIALTDHFDLILGVPALIIWTLAYQVQQMVQTKMILSHLELA